MLDNTALTIVLLVLNVLWFLVLTAATIYTFVSMQTLAETRKERANLRKKIRDLEARESANPALQAIIDDHVDTVNRWTYQDR